MTQKYLNSLLNFIKVERVILGTFLQMQCKSLSEKISKSMTVRDLAIKKDVDRYMLEYNNLDIEVLENKDSAKAMMIKKGFSEGFHDQMME